MAEIFTVHFTLGDEPSKAHFEFKETAIELARILDEADSVERVSVIDMDRNEVWTDD